MKQKILLGLILLPFFSSPSVFAGKLDAFEQDVATPVPPPKQSSSKNKYETQSQEQNSDSCDSILSCILTAIIKALVNSMVESITASPSVSDEPTTSTAANMPVRQQDLHTANANTSDSSNVAPSEAKLVTVSNFTPVDNVIEPAPSMKQVDYSFQSLGSGITGHRFRFTNGNLGNDWAWRLRFTRMQEESDNSVLSLVDSQLYWHSDIAESFRVSAGITASVLSGKKNNYGIGIMLPLSFRVTDSFRFELNPVYTAFNGSYIYDIDFSAHQQSKTFGLFGGFRTLRSPNYSLTGPYIGASVIF